MSYTFKPIPLSQRLEGYDIDNLHEKLISLPKEEIDSAIKYANLCSANQNEFNRFIEGFLIKKVIENDKLNDYKPKAINSEEYLLTIKMMDKVRSILTVEIQEQINVVNQYQTDSWSGNYCKNNFADLLSDLITDLNRK